MPLLTGPSLSPLVLRNAPRSQIPKWFAVRSPFFLSNSLIIGQFQLINSFISQSICADRLAGGRLLPFSVSLHPSPPLMEPLIRASTCESGTSLAYCLGEAGAGAGHGFIQELWTESERGSKATTGSCSCCPATSG